MEGKEILRCGERKKSFQEIVYPFFLTCFDVPLYYIISYISLLINYIYSNNIIEIMD